MRLEARHRFQAVRRHGEVAGEIDVRVAQDRVLGDEAAHFLGEAGGLVQRLDADGEAGVRRRERALLQVLRDEAEGEEEAEVRLRQRRLGAERRVWFAGRPEGVEADLVLLHL